MSVAGGAEDSPGEVAAAVMTALRAVEQVVAGSVVVAEAGTAPLCVLVDLGSEQRGEEVGDVDGHERVPVRAAVGVVLRGEPVETSLDLVELPLNIYQRRHEEVAFQTGRLGPSHPGVADRDEQGELIVAAGQQRGPLGREQYFQGRGPRALRGAVEPWRAA